MGEKERERERETEPITVLTLVPRKRKKEEISLLQAALTATGGNVVSDSGAGTTEDEGLVGALKQAQNEL